MLHAGQRVLKVAVLLPGSRVQNISELSCSLPSKIDPTELSYTYAEINSPKQIFILHNSTVSL